MSLPPSPSLSRATPHRALPPRDSLGTRGHDFLSAELQLGNLPRLLSRDEFMQRFHRAVLADADQELQQVVAAVASWMDSRGAVQARATAELLESRMLTRPDDPRRGGSSDGGASDIAPSSATEPTRAAAADAASELYSARRQQLLLGLQQTASRTLERFEPHAASARLLSTARTALAQTAMLQASAVGLGGVVAVKAAALLDLSGLLPAAMLAATGFGVLPMQRYRAQRELRARVDELTAQLDASVERHLRHELASASARASELIVPFEVLSASARLEHEARVGTLRTARESLDELARAARELQKGR